MTAAAPAAGREREPHWRSVAGLVAVLSRKNFRVRYKRSALGAAWAVIQPAFQAAVLVFVFTQVLRLSPAPEYPLYVLSGVFVWNYFTQAVSGATSAVVDNASLVKKVPVPAYVFPASAAGGSLLAALGGFAVLLVATAVSGHVTWRLLTLPLAIALVTLLVVAVGVLTSALHVRFRDVRYVVDSGLFVAFYATPVLYDIARIPEHLRPWLRLNPMAGVLSLVRFATLSQPVDWTAVAVTGSALALVAVAAALVYRLRAPSFADLV